MKHILLTLVCSFLSFLLIGCGNMPDAPTDLTATSTSPVTLSWKTVPNATSYYVYRGTASGNVSTKTKLASDVTGITYTDSSVEAGKTYYYQITAQNTDGASLPSSEVKVIVPATTAGTTPEPIAVDATGTLKLLSLETIENSRTTTKVNFSTKYQIKNTSLSKQNLHLTITGFTTANAIVFTRNIDTAANGTSTIISTLSHGEALTIKEFDSIVKWTVTDFAAY